MESEISEQDIEEYLTKNLHRLEIGLKLLDRQYPTKYGKIDIFCMDRNKKYVIIEIKKTSNTNSKRVVLHLNLLLQQSI